MERKITREQFIEESLKLFHQRGYKATTIREIAQQLNIEAATIYNYIKSKQELLDSLLFEIANKFQSGIRNIATSSYSPLEQIKLLIAMNVRLTVENPYHVSLLVNEWKHLDEARLLEFLDNRNSYEQQFQAIIAAGIEQKELRPMELELATHTILSAIRWLFSWYTPEKAHLNPFDIEKQMIDFVLKGIAVREDLAYP
ncbi:MAG: TetR/AcrR family transcriptional regulator [Bacteroidota bacterium]